MVVLNISSVLHRNIHSTSLNLGLHAGRSRRCEWLTLAQIPVTDVPPLQIILVRCRALARRILIIHRHRVFRNPRDRKNRPAGMKGGADILLPNVSDGRWPESLWLCQTEAGNRPLFQRRFTGKHDLNMAGFLCGIAKAEA